MLLLSSSCDDIGSNNPPSYGSIRIDDGFDFVRRLGDPMNNLCLSTVARSSSRKRDPRDL